MQYAVFTKPNYASDALLQGRQEVFDDFDRWRKAYPLVKGCLVVQEEPLSQHGDSQQRVAKAAALRSISACMASAFVCTRISHLSTIPYRYILCPASLSVHESIKDDAMVVGLKPQL